MKNSMRIYVHEWGTKEARHLASIAATRDGGIMVIPNNYTNAGWDVYVRPTTSFGPTTEESRTPSEVWDQTVNPRLHYHKSGWTNVEPQGLETDAPKPSVQLTALANITGKQIFALNATFPEAIPTVPLADVYRSPRNLVNHLHDGIPETISMAGIVYPNRIAPWWRKELTEDSNPRFGLRAKDMVENCYSLVGHGINSFMVLRFDHNQGEPDDYAWYIEHVTKGPSISLIGLCGLREWPSPSVQVTTTKRLIVCPIFDRADLPRFPMKMKDRSKRRAHIVRDPATGEELSRQKY